MPEAVVQLLFTPVVLLFVIEIFVTAALGFKMIRRAYLNHLNDHNWRLALLSAGLFLLADALNDTCWAWHLANADVMNRTSMYVWSMVPAILVSTAALFMSWSFNTRAAFFEAQIAAKSTPPEEE